MTIQQVLQILGIIGAIIGAIKWLLSFYFKKSADLENLKDSNRFAHEKSIEGEISNLKGAVSEFRKELNLLNVKINEHAGQLRENNRVMEIVHKNFEKTAMQLEDRYQALNNSEVIKVGENTFIFKTRKS